MTKLIITIFLGPFGVHKFMDKKIGLGFLYLFTGGILGIGWIIDIITAAMALSDKTISTSTKDINSMNKKQLQNLSFLSIEFDDKHYKRIEKFNDSIDDLDYNNINPDDNIKNYEKAINICEDFKNFCYSYGESGIAYYTLEGYKLLEQVKNDYDRYMQEQYAEDKEYYEQELEYEKQERKYQKHVEKINNIIMNTIKNSGGSILQTELLKQFESDDRKIAESIISKCIESGNIIKEKPGSRVILKLPY